MRASLIFDNTYPDREGFGKQFYRGGDRLHIGYTSAQAKPCMCGSNPVFEQYTMDVQQSGKDKRSSKKNIPARVFVVICPVCELRAQGEGELEYVLAQWNAGLFTHDSMMVHQRPQKPSPEAVKALSGIIIADCIEETIGLIHERHRLKERLDNPLTSDYGRETCYTAYKGILAKLRNLEKFFQTSPLMFNRDPDAILSDIRKQIYPGSTEKDIEERLKHPLRLVSM